MAKMDVSGMDYWHVSLRGFRPNVVRAMKVFPQLTTIKTDGLIFQKVRGYHAGGAVLINGKRARESCLECDFPSCSTMRNIEHYLPVGSVGFKFSRVFDDKYHAEAFVHMLNSVSELSSLQLLSVPGRMKDGVGRSYTSDSALEYSVLGVVASRKIEPTIRFYSELYSDEQKDFSLGELRFSTNPVSFCLENTNFF
jgi:hypothetical protein